MQAHTDSELRVRDTLAVEDHLLECPPCRAESLAQRNFQTLLGCPLLQAAPPARLSRHIRQRLAREASAQPRATRLLGWLPRQPVLALAASLLLALLGVGAYAGRSALQSGGGAAPALFMTAAINDHIRQGMLRLPLGVKTADAGLARSWLERNLDAAATVPSLEHERLTLLGARLGYTGDRVAAQVCYTRNGSLVSLYAANGDDLIFPREGTQRYRGETFHIGAMKGYRAVCWKKAGLAYALVAGASEMGSEDLLRLAHQTMMLPTRLPEARLLPPSHPSQPSSPIDTF
ncbi:MAG: hypothetical protein HYY96_17950 [Candidatus Tectomicrobia bacterium]|nr:hypothetical protein [Candidatus Tectomicrobia bacterium]